LNWPKGFPSESTYISVLTKCNHHEIAKALAYWILKARAVEKCEDGQSRLRQGDRLIQTAVDGKILRGTLKHERDDQPPVHLLSFYE
jgi:hypothetical protein